MWWCLGRISQYGIKWEMCINLASFWDSKWDHTTNRGWVEWEPQKARLLGGQVERVAPCDASLGCTGIPCAGPV
jgi:hypothetical protein